MGGGFFRKMFVFVGSGNRRTQRKTSRSREKNPQQTQATYGLESVNPTTATLVGGECYQHCGIPVPTVTEQIFEIGK